MDTSKFQADVALSNGQLLSHFMPISQRFTLKELIQGEEGDHFVELVLALVKKIRSIPVTYGTDFIDTPQKVIHLHYFKGGVDAWIVERDVGDTPNSNGEGAQLQSFGKATIVGGGWRTAEWGYISIQDLIENDVELDLYWEPKTAGDMK